jgi:hypothetical protein
MFDRFSNSFALARSSWQVLRTDKQLVIFPIVSGLVCLLVLASFALPFFVVPHQLGVQIGPDGIELEPTPLLYLLAFAYYFCNYFVIVFCNSALISCALIRFNGGEPTVGDGFSAAMSRLPQIAAWALVSATVGMALKAIENANDKVGKFISGLLGTAWTVITYFVVPVLVVEKAGPFEAISRSLAILKKTWGEALVGNWGLGFILFLLMLPAIALGLAGAIACTTMLVVGVALLLLAGIYLLLWLAVSSALHGIYLGALYQFAAHGAVPNGFERENLVGAFTQKQKSGWLS